MNLHNWKQRYAPTSASAFKSLSHEDIEVQLAAAKHSLRKWIGLRRWNKLTSEAREALFPTSDNCALCQLNLERGGEHAPACETCPLYEARGFTSCDEETGDAKVKSPYGMFSYDKTKTPEPMIYWLKLVVRRLVRELYAKAHVPLLGSVESIE